MSSRERNHTELRALTAAEEFEAEQSKVIVCGAETELSARLNPA